MMQPEVIIRAITESLDKNIPFVAYKLPGEKEVIFFADDMLPEKGESLEVSRRFIVCCWGNRPKVTIRARLDAEQTLKFVQGIAPCSVSNLPFPKESTRLEDYITGVEKITAELKINVGKVVISRCEILKNDKFTNRFIAEKALEIFASYKSAMGYIYYTPETGCWVGASPETLVDCNLESGEFSTMALAGTRKSGNSCEWDEKNLREHRFVVDHICSRLADMPTAYVCHKTSVLKIAGIEHLLTKIEGKMENIDSEKLLLAIHPTPAIAGFPTKEAIRLIAGTETHNRLCYGGYVAIDDGKRFLAHVNLRCFAFAKGWICLYGGGGIIGESQALTEWEETDMKIKATRNFLE